MTRYVLGTLLRRRRKQRLARRRATADTAATTGPPECYWAIAPIQPTCNIPVIPIYCADVILSPRKNEHR